MLLKNLILFHWALSFKDISYIYWIQHKVTKADSKYAGILEL